MVIRAKDQASRVINTMSRGVSADFKRLQTAATLTAQRSALDMARVRQTYSEQILHQQKLMNTAMAAGNTQRVKFRQGTIRDLRAMQQEEVLGIRQEQIAQKQIMATARANHEARQAAIEGKRAAASAAGTWIAVGAGMALAGAMGIKALHGMAMASVEYQRQATLTQTQLGKQQATVEELQNISTSVAKTVGVPIMELQGALYDIFSSTDVKVKDSQKVLETFAKAAVAGQVDVQQVSGATISVMNGFGKGVEDLTDIMDVQFAAVRLGRMTFDQLTAAIGKGIPSAVAANQSFEELAGSMAFLTRAGLTASQAAISFARLSDLFRRADVPEELKKLGIEAFDAGGKMRPLSQLLSELAVKFGPLKATARAELFKKIFGGQGTIMAQRFFNLAMEGSAQLRKYIDQVTKSTGDFQAAYEKMSASVAVKTIVLKNNWEIFKMQLGEAAIPILNKLMDIGIKVLGWFNDLSPAQRNVLAATMALVSGIVFLSGVLIALAGAVKMVGAALGILRLEALATSGALNGINAASVLARLGIVGLIAAATVWAGIKFNTELHKSADEAERTGRMLTLGGKGGQFFADSLVQGRSALNDHSAALARQLPLIRDDHEGLAGLAAAASMAAGGIDKVGTSHKNAAGPIGKVIELTDEEKKKFQELAAQIVTSGIEGMAARQDRIAEATQRLRDAQNDLAKAQRGGTGTTSTLSTANERLHDASVRVEKAQISLSDKAKDSRLEHIRLREAQHDLTVAQAAARTSNSKTSGSLDGVKDATQRVKDAQKALAEATGETAEETLRRFREEADAARDWSKNMRTLLQRGVDPALVAELAKQGPAEIAKFVGKGKAFYADLNEAFREKSAAMRVTSRITNLAMTGQIGKFVKNGKLDVAALSKAVGLSMGQSRGKVVDNAARSRKAWKDAHGDMSRATVIAMNKAGESVSKFRSKANTELGKLRGHKITIPIKGTFTPPHGYSGHSITGALAAKGGYLAGAGKVVRRAQGGIIRMGTGPTADDVPVMASKGEYVVNARATAKHRPLIEKINRDGLPGFARGGYITGVDILNSGGSQLSPRIQAIIDNIGRRLASHIKSNTRYLLPGGVGKPGILNFIRSTDRLPYIWGGTGPGGYDCSGLVSAVHGMMLGMKKAGHGLRLYTTGSIHAGVAGLKAGLGGTLQIGVTPGVGHMAGRYGRLGFEAESTRTGIKIGAAASRPESFSRHYHLARGGYVSKKDLETMAILGRMRNVDIGGDYARIRLGLNGQTKMYHQGGRLPEDILGVGGSGKTYAFQKGEDVVANGGSRIVVNINGPVYGAEADQLADKIQQALLRKKRRIGGIDLGLG